jgi:hypothetical protein
MRHASGDPHRVPATDVGTSAAVAIAEPLPAPTGSVPVISVDSLPVSPNTPGTGRILIGSSPGSCAVSVDGMKRGPTPLPPIDLSPGLHVIRCDAPNGKTKTDSIFIREGATARHKFSLD